MSSKYEGISGAYFKWMCGLVSGSRFSKASSFDRLLRALHDTDFTYIISRDSDRVRDGLNLRYLFAYEHYDIDDAESYIQGPCSVLEMMVALSLRCERNIMDNPAYGDRTGQWFWGMVVSLGLGSMMDDRFDEKYVDDVLTRFLNREYEPNGKGGLFTIKNCKRDLREVEIWYQLNWYLDNIV